MNLKNTFSELKSRLASFRIGRLSQWTRSLDIPLTEDEILDDLEFHHGNDHLLGRYSEQEVYDALAEYGVWKTLTGKGYPNAAVAIKSIDPFRQKICIFSSRNDSADEESKLCELRVFDASLHGPCPLTGETFRVDALVIDWLHFQDPKAMFTTEKPQLPGQKYPGLGILRTSIQAIINLSKQVGKEAVINIPEYYHNAVLYHPAFRFFSAYVEGRFLALRKFLSDLTLAEASHAVHEGKIFNVVKQEPFAWKPHEQILPLTPRIKSYFDSELYQKKVQESETNSRFSWSKLNNEGS